MAYKQQVIFHTFQARDSEMKKSADWASGNSPLLHWRLPSPANLAGHRQRTKGHPGLCGKGSVLVTKSSVFRGHCSVCKGLQFLWITHSEDANEIPLEWDGMFDSVQLFHFNIWTESKESRIIGDLKQGTSAKQPMRKQRGEAGTVLKPPREMPASHISRWF